MNIILDILIIIIVALFMLGGYKKGFVMSLLSFICSVVSLVTSFFLSPFCSSWVYEEFVKDTVINNITRAISNSVNQSIDIKVENILSSIPFNIKDILELFGISESKIGTLVSGSVTNSSIAIERLLYPVIINYMNILVGILLFFIIFVGIKLISKLIFKAIQVPMVVRHIDWLLGMLFGMFKGLIFVFVLLATLNIANRFDKSGNLSKYVSEEDINSTFIFKNIYNQNPIYKLKETLKNYI